MLEVAKINKRLVIRDATTKATVYCPPSFLRPVRDRDVMRQLAERMSDGEGIAAIMAFETAHSPRAGTRKPGAG